MTAHDIPTHHRAFSLSCVFDPQMAVLRPYINRLYKKYRLISKYYRGPTPLLPTVTPLLQDPYIF